MRRPIPEAKTGYQARLRSAIVIAMGKDRLTLKDAINAADLAAFIARFFFE